MVEGGAKNKALTDMGSLPPEPGDVIAGKYRVESLVGSGGMGVVVAARHLQLGQRVAIKLLRLSGLEPDRQLEARARFLREGQAAAGLSSDHVVRIHDVGTLDSGEPFMVMELLRGDDLSALIERQGPAPVSAAVDYVLQACHAVAEAHAAGIVHRDLKPSNLFVSMRSDGRATVKVLDFGISKTKSAREDAYDGNLTDTRSVVGSPYYMSPEQVRDAKRVDVRTDVWSLGMILYELLVGDPAFNGETLPAICAAIAADTPAPIRATRPDVPEALDAVVQKCLAKNPDARYQTVDELVGALAAFAPGSSVGAGADYASSRSVLALSEPFSVKSRAAETLHVRTDQPAALVSAAAIPDANAPGGAAATKVEPSAPKSGSGARRRAEFANSATLVSSSSRTGAAQSGDRSDARWGRTRLLVAVSLVGALISFSFVAFGPHKAPPPAAPQAVKGAGQRPTTAAPPPPSPPAPAELAPPPVSPPATVPRPAELAPPNVAAAAPAASAARPDPGPSAARPQRSRKPHAPATTAAPTPSDIRLER